MPEKLLTIKELSEYLQVSEEKINVLVSEKVIFAYKIGGEILRFRKDQIDAIRAEIYSRISKADEGTVSEVRRKVKDRFEGADKGEGLDTLRDRIADFFYFNDFYIVSGLLIIILLIMIFRG
jgi:excisionase family DNA binding protein